MKKVLIVKNGALGDVVRTSYFVKYLHEKYDGVVDIYWKTKENAFDLISGTNLLNIVFVYKQLQGIEFDHVYSLDDEHEELVHVAQLSKRALTGAFLDEYGKPVYTNNSSLWFDMGLISKYGKIEADNLKKNNSLTHIKIFKTIFEMEDIDVEPNYIGKMYQSRIIDNSRRLIIGINPYAGGRWVSKELPEDKLITLIEMLYKFVLRGEVAIVLLGVGDDYNKNKRIESGFEDEYVYAIDTSVSLSYMAKAISELDYLITSDSLALHLAISQGIPYCAFFAPTSASEVENTKNSTKIISETNDYCTYRSNVDTSTITPQKIYAEAERFIENSK